MAAAPYAYLKRFHFTGLVELEYRDYSLVSTYHGRKAKSEWTSFGQRYRFGLRGYVYHPKFLSFSTSVTFRKEKTDQESGGGSDTKDINYDLFVSILPTTPVSLDIYGLKTNSTIEGWGAAPYNITSNSYGARLYFTKRNFPSITLEYNHWDYTIEREREWKVLDTYEGVVKKLTAQEKSESNRLSANIKGFIDSINTSYYITGDFSDYSSPFRKYDGKNILTNTYTTIKKENTLSLSFQHSDIDITKLTMFTANLKLFPIGQLHHRYSYEYNTSEQLLSETKKINLDSHTIGNYLLYRFSKLIFGTAQFHYKFAKRDGVQEDLYDINTQLNYGKTIRDFDFTSYYSFSFSKEERRGEFKLMEHSLGFGLSTRKFRLGKVYTNYDISFDKYDFHYTVNDYDYDFSYQTSEEPYVISEKAHFMEHRIKVGINGRGPARVYWNIETEGRIFDSEIKNHGTVFWIGEEQWAEKIRHYTFTGDIGYPFGQKGLATLKVSYTTGQTDSEDIQGYNYEGRVNCHLLRNLNLLAWWREEWRNRGWWAGRFVAGRKYGRKTREYQIALHYLIYRMTISLEYNVYRVDEGPYSTENKRLYLKLRRPF
ncbi:MAG: hypothetical protein L6290_13030 [Thermodesulfovibrionales bacterium]|nr:hypothetical protein [Thermodesulfovibrionales bacterium]